MKNITILILALTLSVSLFAQDETLQQPIDLGTVSLKGSAVVGAFGEIVPINTKPENAISKNIYSKPSYLAEEFTGYSIQLTTSMERLKNDNALFAEFGNLMIEEATNPKYCYMLGEFNTKEGAEKFLKTVILERYPDAKVIRYKEGDRKRLK
ncbi:MAG: hypothetical protein HC803_05115 [Saprospiraceae bacterium]|nr:hypothetical protein [Saprospiraceae bacterium]